ncbi:MAG: hypothetical protein GF383_07205 [Candidatus Lokiarchaeota archaeon]|nr:hypothetical protein [Candidatus Lokiarchaeota archaeon]MBD3339955.1 hypothetical protein [Candidatus Lokiarchaeota archaeon]
MSEQKVVYDFKEAPKKFDYIDTEPFKLSNELFFFHNKHKFRRYLNKLQYLFRNYTGTALHAAGIRDTYLKLEYTEKYKIVVLTDKETIKNTNKIIAEVTHDELPKDCYLIKSTSDYMILIAHDVKNLVQGIDQMEEILTQTFEYYVAIENYDGYIKITPFELLNCPA